MPKNNLKEENPHASFLTDIMRKKYDTDIALINAGTIRGAFSSGDISTRDIGEIFPFKDKIAVIDITEEKLVQAVKYCATALKQEDGKPGLLQVSGIRYSVSDDGELTSLLFENKQGAKNLIDINNPSSEKTYSIALPAPLTKGLDGFSMFKTNDDSVKIFDEHYSDIVIDYIKNCAEYINIQKDERINIV